MEVLWIKRWIQDHCSHHTCCSNMSKLPNRGEAASCGSPITADDHNKPAELISVSASTYKRCVWGRVWEWVPPHRLIDVDVMHKEGNEVAEKKVELEKDVTIHRQVGDLAVLQRYHCLCGQRGARHACSRTIPADKTKHFQCSGLLSGIDTSYSIPTVGMRGKHSLLLSPAKGGEEAHQFNRMWHVAKGGVGFNVWLYFLRVKALWWNVKTNFKHRGPECLHQSQVELSPEKNLECLV